MGQYVLLMKDHSEGLKAMHDNALSLDGIKEGLERWEAKVIANFRLIGEWDQCYIFDLLHTLLAALVACVHVCNDYYHSVIQGPTW